MAGKIVYYGWNPLGDQERCMRYVSMLGPWLLMVVENGWHGDAPIYDMYAKLWNNNEKGYEVKYKHRDVWELDHCKSHLEDWYACSVIAEELMMDGGTDETIPAR